MMMSRTLDGRLSIRFFNGKELILRNLVTGLFLIISIFILFLISLNLGTIDTGLHDFWRLMRGEEIEQQSYFALWDVRLPRLALAFLIGWCVAVSGAILQPIARNPLADPGLFGISHGSLTTTILLLAFVPAASRVLIAFASLAGGLGTAILLIVLVGNRHAGGLVILLMGIAVATVLASVNSFLILYLPTEASYNASSWMAGSLFQANWLSVTAFIPLFLFSLVAMLIAGHSLNRYDLGNELALALGEPVIVSRPLLLLFAVLLSAASVTIVGPLAFLGILAPQLAQFLTGANGSGRLYLSGLVGANLIIGADIISKNATTISMPLGLTTTILGVPLFIVVLRLRTLRQYFHK
ncbi:MULTISPECIES: FecCD family ABC transporter permease [Bartonella]|uniref:FecCD family ABC transporter permease n=1 Tax=Bartonella TaxID=773 RepID=UPI00350F1046